MRKIKTKFTKWYAEQGYKFGHRGCELYWDCPSWVKPMLGLFLPSAYMRYKVSYSY